MKTNLRSLLVASSILLVVCSLSAPVWADYAAGSRAFEQGDYAMALKEWLPLATAGDAEAQTGIGFMYQTGKGVAHDPKEAAKWFRFAAEHGHAGAQSRLALSFTTVAMARVSSATFKKH